MVIATENITRLRRWLDRAGLNQIGFSRLIESDPATVNKILKGIRRPSFVTAANIERQTGIPASSWLPSRVDIHQRTIAVAGRKRK